MASAKPAKALGERLLMKKPKVRWSVIKASFGDHDRTRIPPTYPKGSLWIALGYPLRAGIDSSLLGGVCGRGRNPTLSPIRSEQGNGRVSVYVSRRRDYVRKRLELP